MDELLVRQMPHSPEAEQAVLGSMLIDAECVKDVMDKLQPGGLLSARRTARSSRRSTPCSVYSKPIDGVTVRGRDGEERSSITSNTRSYLLQLMEITPTSANVMEYAAIVRDKALHAQPWPPPPGTSPPWCRREPARQATCSRRRSRRSMPSAAAATPRDMVTIGVGAAGRAGAASTELTAAGGEKAAGALHGLFRGRQQDPRPERFRPPAAGRPSRYGQDQLWR